MFRHPLLRRLSFYGAGASKGSTPRISQSRRFAVYERGPRESTLLLGTTREIRTQAAAERNCASCKLTSPISHGSRILHAIGKARAVKWAVAAF